jgi:ParB-like chromosome segregation protein Spo0J
MESKSNKLADKRAVALARRIAAIVAELPLEGQVATLNAVRLGLRTVSPFAAEPVDCVLWVKAEEVHANDYNPNRVAPPEMELLRLSVQADGYTQPVVTHREDDRREVVDGFHRRRVGAECPEVRERVHGYLPVVTINSDRGDRKDRIAATIRHNRARGRHAVDLMSEIVADLARRGWDDAKIGKELGMDPDEVLRLKQITGLAELFAGREFSEAWDVPPRRKPKKEGTPP